MRMSHELGRPFRASGFSTRQSQGVALGCDRPHLWCFEPALRCRLIIGVAEAVIDGLWCFGPALRCRLIIGVAKTEIDGLGYFDPSRHRRLIVGMAEAVIDRVTAFWTAVAQMHGASLHRSYRFRWLHRVPWPQPAVRPAKAASRPGLPVLRSAQCEEGPHALIRCALPGSDRAHR